MPQFPPVLVRYSVRLLPPRAASGDRNQSRHGAFRMRCSRVQPMTDRPRRPPLDFWLVLVIIGIVVVFAAFNMLVPTAIR